MEKEFQNDIALMPKDWLKWVCRRAVYRSVGRDLEFRECIEEVK